jgi:hypothetical protein
MTCIVTGHSPKDDISYGGQETHKWEIIPWLIYTDSNNNTYYAENWTASGSGSKSGNTWTVNAHGSVPGYLWFRLPVGSNLLEISRVSSQQTAQMGSTSGSVLEIPFPTTDAATGAIDIVQGSLQKRAVPANILTNEPADGVNDWDCMWKFEYRPLYLSPKPGALVRPPLVR